MVFRTISLVFRDKTYREKLLLSFFALIVVAAFLLNFVSLPAFLQGSILFTESVPIAGLAFLVTFSALASLALTLHIYKIDKYREQTGKEKIGIAGAFLGLFTSACSVCYPLILTFLGVPTALAILPLGGIEIQIISILLLLLSIYFISRGIEKCESCKVDKK